MDISLIKEKASKNLNKNLIPICVTLLLVGLIPFIISIVEHFVTEPLLLKMEEISLILSKTMDINIFNHYFYHFLLVSGAYYLWTIIFSFSEIFFFFFELSVCAMYLVTAQDEKYRVKDFKDAFKKLKQSFTLNFLKSLKVTLWSFLFIVPGIIKFFSYSMANHVRLEKPELSANQCLKESEEMMKGKKGLYLAFLLSFFGWIMLYVLFCTTVENLVFFIKIDSVIINAVLLVLVNAITYVAFLPLEAYIGVADAHFYLCLVKEKEGRENFADFDKESYQDFVKQKETENKDKTSMFDFVDGRDDFIKENFSEPRDDEPFSSFNIEETDKKTDDTPFGDF